MFIRLIEKDDYEIFKRLFCDYYAELDCEEAPLPLFDEYLLPDLQAGLFSVAVAESGAENGEKICGFVIYQVDDILNDWNFKEGCGDLRELYIAPPFRRRGLGRALVKFCESELIKQGAGDIYTLPVEESESFFVKCGYADGGEYCAEADNKVFVKKLKV